MPRGFLIASFPWPIWISQLAQLDDHIWIARTRDVSDTKVEGTLESHLQLPGLQQPLLARLLLSG